MRFGRIFRAVTLLSIGMTGCMGGKRIYSDGDPSIIGNDCGVRRLRYADHVKVVCKDHATYDGTFLGSDCRQGPPVLLLSAGTVGIPGQRVDTLRVAVPSISEIRYARTDYAGTAMVVVLGCVAVALLVALAVGGSWLTVPD